MNKITITNTSTAPIGDFYGIFFEDINHAADGGLYGEMIRNRAFEFSPIDHPSYQSLTAWKCIEEGGASVAAAVSNKQPLSEKNPNYLVLSIEKAGSRAGIKNLGYNSGIAIRKNEQYLFSCYACAEQPCTVTISIDDVYGKTHIAKELYINSPEWTQYSLELTAPTDDFCAVLAITAKEPCKLCLDFVSLFPRNTFKGRANGLRTDIAQLLADLKPRFMRFPGGCLIHDGSLNSNDRNSMYRWKNTVGDITERPARRNNWRYHQSLGLGYFEYFQFCEDIGAKPLPVLPAGYNPHMEQAAALDEMQEWIDDALDLIEFANGSSDTKWGSLRTKMGHAEPFGLEYIAIGNEEVGRGFWDRYDLFHKALREKYPDIKIINSAGPFPAGGEYERGWENARKNASDFVDEHYYTSPEWMLANYHRYDNFPDSPKVFVGEYASWGNTFYNALIEAAYMTGLENNARSVGLACYAPLLCNVDYVNWEPNLIWFDNHRAYGSANYYVQKLFMNNIGTELLKTEKCGLDNGVTLGSNIITGDIALATENCNAAFFDVTVTDLTNGVTETQNDFSLSSNETRRIGAVDTAHYKVTFRAKKQLGQSGFQLQFGKTDSENMIRWLIGGWANQHTEISSLINNKSSTLDQNMFSLDSEREYLLCLEVNSREITAYVDGHIVNQCTDHLPIIEELYYTASRDASHIYIKCVNVREESVTTQFQVDGINQVKAKVFTLSGNDEDKNSFDAPTKISPVETLLSSETNMLDYTFPSKSVTVFVIER